MSTRKKKILLGIFVPLVVFGLGVSGIYIGSIVKRQLLAKLSGPVLDFPVVNPGVIDVIWGYGDHGGDFHNGIDFGNNDTMTVVAWCDLEVGEIDVWYNELGGHWQVNLDLIFNARYRFGVGFESGAQNETYANIQKDGLNITKGDILQKGEIIGNLFVHGPGSHIHFGMYDESIQDKERTVCAYSFSQKPRKPLFMHFGTIVDLEMTEWYNG